jgi:hypothetical protein
MALLGHLLVETGTGSAVVPLMEPARWLRWRVAGTSFLLDDADDDAPPAPGAPALELAQPAARTRLRWHLAYRQGRFWVTGSERPLTLLAGVTLDPSAVVDWPGGATLTFEGLPEVRVGLERHLPVPGDTVHCPGCGKKIRPRPLVPDTSGAFGMELVRRGLFGGGASSPETHKCPECRFAFGIDDDVLAPSVFETYCDWIDARAGHASTLIVTVTNDDDGRSSTLRFHDPQEVIVGRGSGCSIVLADDEIETMHARISRAADGTLWIDDLASDNGTYVNGERIERPRAFREGDRIVLGPFTLLVAWRNVKGL